MMAVPSLHWAQWRIEGHVSDAQEHLQAVQRRARMWVLFAASSISAVS
jgi:hypothetical protein